MTGQSGANHTAMAKITRLPFSASHFAHDDDLMMFYKQHAVKKNTNKQPNSTIIVSFLENGLYIFNF